MKKTARFTKTLFLFTALALTLALIPGALAADSPSYGSEVWLQDTALQDGVILSDNLYWSDYYSKPRHEYYITYSPGGWPVSEEFPGPTDQETGEEAPSSGEEERQPDTEPPFWLRSGLEDLSDPSPYTSPATGVFPTVYYGSSVCDRNTAAAAASYYESLGYRVLGIINGDFYNTGSGSPLGLLVDNGEILSSCGGLYAVGFCADGSSVIGKPELSITAQTGEITHSITAINKSDSAGITMWTSSFRSDHATGGLAEGPEVIATILEGRAAIGGQMTVQVAEVMEGTGHRVLQDNQIVLSAPGDGGPGPLAFLRALTPGQTITLSFSTVDPKWNNVVSAVGALHLLVDNGVAQTGFEVSAAPRTAVGVKANGDLVLYTIDGRQNSHSMGCSLGVLAKRMEELGCITALCLDGGGSTTAMASLPNGTSAKQINSPSDGSQRKVSNLIALLAPGGATGQPHAVNLSASAPAVLVGHTVTFSANLADSHYYPMDGAVQFSASAGTMDGNILTAPAEAGTVTVTASYGNISAQIDVLVVDDPDSAAIQQDGSTITALTLHPGETVQLGGTVSYRHRTLEANANDFVWWMSPELGTIDSDGTVHAVQTGVDVYGYITATIGSQKVRIPTSVRAVTPFADTAGHWAEDYMTRLYYEDILRGTEEDGKLMAYPDRGVSRAEFAVLLCRYLGVDTAQYAGIETPFADIDQVDTWALDSVRAMYAMDIIRGSTVDGQTVFEPRGILTRSQAVTMLDRMLSMDKNDAEPALPDVSVPPDGEIVTELPDISDGNVDDGMSDIPNDAGADEDSGAPADGEQSDGLTGLSEEGEPPQGPIDSIDLTQFDDADEVPSYAVEHFQSLVALGIIEGADNKLEPNAAMTRAAICKVLVTLP